MILLSSGYAGIGFFTRIDGAVLPCPKCNGHDSIRHMILGCEYYHDERSLLFDKVADATSGRIPMTLMLLLGFHDLLPNETLKVIMTHTAQYVLDIGRQI